MSTGELTKEDGSLDVDAANELFNEYDKKYREDNPAEEPKAEEKTPEDQPPNPNNPLPRTIPAATRRLLMIIPAVMTTGEPQAIFVSLSKALV